jgi:hypothetical protein
MYSFFLAEINLNEANCQSQNKAIAAKNLQNQQKKTKSTKPLPLNFRYDANKVCILCLSFIHGWKLIKTFYLVHYLSVAEFDCPSCECKGTVMTLIEVDDLRRQKTAFTTEFEKRMLEFNNGVGKKPRRTKFPQQQYACCCPTMRTYRW